MQKNSLSFRDAPLGAGPQSITTIGVMDSGLAPHATNDFVDLREGRAPE